MNISVVRIGDTTDPLVLRTLLASPAEAISRGKLVAFPTETVYGLGANALDPRAVERVFTAKGRPNDNPLIVHVASKHQVLDVAQSVTPLAQELMDAFWPGPLTIILHAKPEVPQNVTAGLDSVAVRLPDNPIAQTFIALSGRPIVGPSANLSGRPSPTTATHVLQDLPIGPDWIIDGGTCAIGIESTVVDARGSSPTILREGKISREDLAPWMDNPVTDMDTPPMSFARSPGTTHPHYKPDALVVLAQPGELWDVAREWGKKTDSVGVITSSDPAMQHANSTNITVLGTFSSTEHLATNLYGWLRYGDEMRFDAIVVEAVPNAGLGRAVMDRLRRASLNPREKKS